MARAFQLFRRAGVIILWAWVSATALAQDPSSANPPSGVSEHLPARRSFPSLPINDLRAGAERALLNPAARSGSNGTANEEPSQVQGTPVGEATVNQAGLSNGNESQAAVSPPPAHSTPPTQVPAQAPLDPGNTSGVFLRTGPQPVTDPLSGQQTSPNPGSLLAPMVPGTSRSGPQPFHQENQISSPAPTTLNQTGVSRPVELIDPAEPIQDSAIQLAAGVAFTEATPKGNAYPSADSSELVVLMLQRYAVDQAMEPLPGRPMHLEEALQAVRPEVRRTVIRQYWTTWGAWANYLNQSELCARLASVRATADQTQRQLLEAARMMAEDERMQAEIRLNWAQVELQRMLPSSGSELLPLPQDLPLAQAYETHYDWYVANGALPPQLRAIAQTLPKQLKLITSRANTLEVAELNVRQLTQSMNVSPVEIGTQLAANEMLAKAKRALIPAVLDYNQWIADYSLTIAPAGQAPAMVAGMLVAPRERESESGRSVLALGTGPQANDAWARTPGSESNAATRVGPGSPSGLAAPAQPIERVSGLELNPQNPGAVVPAVAPALGGAAPMSNSEGRFGVPSQPTNPPGTFPSAAPSGETSSTAPAAAPSQPFGFNPAANPRPNPPAGGSFGAGGSFAPPPNIPSFDPPAGSPNGSGKPVGSGGTEFKLGG